MKVGFPANNVIRAVEKRHARMRRIIPDHPDLMSDIQKYHQFVKDPMIVTRVAPDIRAPFIQEMQRIVAKYGGQKDASRTGLE